MSAEPVSNGAGADGMFLLESRPDALVEASAVLHGAGVTQADVSAIEISGPAAVECMQGLVTIDLKAHGDMLLQYGALLTAKGRIACDMWVAVNETSLTLYPDSAGTDKLLLVLNRSLPPRLATVINRSDERRILRLVGPSASDLAAQVGFVVTPDGKTITETDRTFARPPSGTAPFSLQIDCAAAEVDATLAALSAAGVSVLSRYVLELTRILGGWPRLGAEINEKTLPQEVRYDELGGISYTKGCYLGQETVTRLHYRGHTNKRMLGLKLQGTPDTTDRTVKREERAVGRLTSAAWFGPEHGYLGLGIISNEVGPGEFVSAGNVPTWTSTLPFEIHK
jgi:folate-binding protein YgfZ